MIAAAFLGDCPPGHHVNHINHDKTDNRLANLEYTSPSGNKIHALKEQRVSNTLSPEIVRWIRGIGDSRPRAAIARELGIDPSTVSRILLGETYQWIE